MPQLLPEFHQVRKAAYDLALGGEASEALVRLRNEQDAQHNLLVVRQSTKAKLALGTLSVDAAQIHLLSSVHTFGAEQPLPLDSAFGSIAAAIDYLKEPDEIEKYAEALSVAGLLHIAQGLSEPHGAGLIPEFERGGELAKQSQTLRESIGNFDELPATAIIRDTTKRMYDWGGRRVTNGFFKQSVIKLLEASRAKIREEVRAQRTPKLPGKVSDREIRLSDTA